MLADAGIPLFDFLLYSIKVMILRVYKVLCLNSIILLLFKNVVYPLFITLSDNRYTRVPSVCGQRSAGFVSKALARAIASSTCFIKVDASYADS